jgi:hypothetical protein
MLKITGYAMVDIAIWLGVLRLIWMAVSSLEG